MIEQGINAVALLAAARKDAEFQAKEPIDINGEKYWPGQKEPIPPAKLHAPPTLQLSTLSSLAEYVVDDPDEDATLDYERYVLVESPTRVSVVRTVLGGRKERIVEAMATCRPADFRFATWHEQESFNISLQYQFVDNDDRKRLLLISGNLHSEKARTAVDDGASQEVVARSSVNVGPTRQTVVQPFFLQPFRTFSEVEQPESPFIVRFQSRGEGEETKHAIALFPADGGLWEVTAVQRIAEFLRGKIATAQVYA